MVWCALHCGTPYTRFMREWSKYILLVWILIRRYYQSKTFDTNFGSNSHMSQTALRPVTASGIDGTAVGGHGDCSRNVVVARLLCVLRWTLRRNFCAIAGYARFVDDNCIILLYQSRRNVLLGRHSDTLTHSHRHRVFVMSNSTKKYTICKAEPN